MGDVNRIESLPLLVDVQPAELLVHDSVEPCPYLEGQQARMPLRLPIRQLERHELDTRLARGDRRHGALFYRPTCPDCDACEAIRLPADFPLRRGHRRALRRGDRELRVEIGPPRATLEHVRLYDLHRFGRGLTRDASTPMSLVGYQRFLVDRQCDAFELTYYHQDRMVGAAVVDRGEAALSAVYCFYDPALRPLGIGTYSILKQLELCREWNLEWLYLGLYIAGCEAMEYKARFRPHERRVRGTWTRFD